mgnify:CR=1 FL=1
MLDPTSLSGMFMQYGRSLLWAITEAIGFCLGVGISLKVFDMLSTDIDEWDEKFKILLNPTDHLGNPTSNAQIGTDAPSLTVRINDDDASEVVEFSTTAVISDENDVINVEGSDPGANSINLPITIAKESAKNIVLKYSIDHTYNYPEGSDFYYDADFPNNENIATKGYDYNFGTVTTNVAGDSICLLYTSDAADE